MFLLIREKRKRSIFNRKKAKRNFCPLKKKNWKKKSPLLSKRTIIRFELAITFLKNANQAEKYAQQKNPERIRNFSKRLGGSRAQAKRGRGNTFSKNKNRKMAVYIEYSSNLFLSSRRRRRREREASGAAPPQSLTISSFLWVNNNSLQEILQRKISCLAANSL